LSEPIYEGEIVRVIFEENLTDGNYIDFYARSNRTVAYFDIYELEQTICSNSQIIDNPEMQYILLHDVSRPSDTFDLRYQESL